MKKIYGNLYVKDYAIEYSYETKRKNKKTQIIQITHISKEMAQRDFWIWISNLNELKSYRSISNVKILDIQESGGEYINL